MLGTWLNKSNLTLQNVSNGMDNKATATVGVTTSGVKANQPLPLKKLLNPRVLIPALNYACLALVDIATRAIQPVFYSTPVELGGLGLSPHHIGKILSIYGILNGILQIFYFAKTHARFGTKNVYIAGIASSLLVFVSFPIINHLARTVGDREWLLWLAVGFQVIASIFINFSYGMCLIVVLLSQVKLIVVYVRLYLHLHHRLIAQPRIAWFCQRSRAVECLNCTCRGPSCRELALFPVH